MGGGDEEETGKQPGQHWLARGTLAEPRMPN